MNELPDEDAVADLQDSVESILTQGSTAGPRASAAPPSLTTKVGLDVVMRVPVTVQVVLGKVKMPVSELMKLKQGAVIALDRSLGEPVDLIVNGHLVARGEIIVLDETSKRFGVSLTEIVESPSAA